MATPRETRLLISLQILMSRLEFIILCWKAKLQARRGPFMY